MSTIACDICGLQGEAPEVLGPEGEPLLDITALAGWEISDFGFFCPEHCASNEEIPADWSDL